jgi:pimeloyl-ACP methyl ester carboxylesterase
VKHSIFLIFCLIFSISNALANPPSQPLGIHLEGYEYPYPVKYFQLNIENKKLKMAYMDVSPEGEPLGTIVLLHGGLAFGAYWKDTMQFLKEKGYRVIVPDQLGFGKSSKQNIHFNLHLLAKNTKELLDNLGVKNAIFVGHSFGGMLATEFALMYPDAVSKLILEDPLSLEDYRVKIPFKSFDDIYQGSLHPTWESILNIHKSLYAHWDEKFSEYAEVTYRVSLNEKFSKVAAVQASIYEMIYAEPIVYQLSQLKMPVLFIYGKKDRTAPGKQFASEENQKTLGNFPELINSAAKSVPHAEVIAFDDVAHVPHLEMTKQFEQVVMAYIKE